MTKAVYTAIYKKYKNVFSISKLLPTEPIYKQSKRNLVSITHFVYRMTTESFYTSTVPKIWVFWLKKLEWNNKTIFVVRVWLNFTILRKDSLDLAFIFTRSILSIQKSFYIHVFHATSLVWFICWMVDSLK